MPAKSPLEGMLLLYSFLEVHGHSGGDSHRTMVASDLEGDRASQSLVRRAWVLMKGVAIIGLKAQVACLWCPGMGQTLGRDGNSSWASWVPEEEARYSGSPRCS